MIQKLTKKNVADAMHKNSPAAPFLPWMRKTANVLLPLLQRVRRFEGDTLPLHLAAPVRQMARLTILGLPRSLKLKLPVATPTSTLGVPRALTVTTKVAQRRMFISVGT